MVVVVLDGGVVVESSFCRWTQALSTRYLVAVFGRALYLFVVGELSSFLARVRQREGVSVRAH